MLHLYFFKVAFDFGVCRLAIFRDSGVLERRLNLREGFAIVQCKDSLAHPETRLDVLGVVVEDPFALVHHLIELIQIKAAHRQIAAACHLGFLACLTLR